VNHLWVNPQALHNIKYPDAKVFFPKRFFQSPGDGGIGEKAGRSGTDLQIRVK